MTRRRFLQGAALALGTALAGFRYLAPLADLKPKVLRGSGPFPFREDVEMLDPNPLRLGWVIYETVGIVVVNDYEITTIEIGDSHAPRKLVDYSRPVLAA